MPQAILRLRAADFEALLEELAARGQGRRESGAFLLAPKDGDRRLASEVVFFDDLDPDALNGAIHLRAFAFARLWRICRERGLVVVADLHTHPGERVSQSSVDASNPLIAREGHVAIIAPSFARGSRRVRDLGIHIYRGNAGWASYLDAQAEGLIYVGRFP